MPNAIYVKTLFFRPEITSKYNLNNAPATMEQLLEFCRAITKPEQNQYGFDFRGKGYPTAFIDIVMTSFFDDIDPNCMYLKRMAN